MFKKYFQLFIFWLATPLVALAGIEPVYTNQLKHDEILNVRSFKVYDDKYGTSAWSTIVSTQRVDNAVIFELDEKAATLHGVQLGSFDATIEAVITGIKASGEQLSHYKRFHLRYDAHAGKTASVKSIFQFKDCHVVEVQVISTQFKSNEGHFTSWNGDHLPPIFNLRGDITIERVLPFNANQAPSSISGDLVAYQRFALNWAAYDGADEYDVEWTFYDQTSQVATAQALNKPHLYENNASRLTLKKTTHYLTLVYPQGRLYYRVRAAQYDAQKRRITSQWQYGNVYQTTGHETNWHWQTQLIFAEEGKFTQSVKYYDASLRERQTAMLSNAAAETPKQAIVTIGGTIYDYQGRAALKVMPAPLKAPELGYQPNLAMNRENTPFSRRDFVSNGTTDCTQEVVNGMSVTASTGAAHYYSPNNPLANTQQNRTIPDANGYPFSVTEFTPDATGRIARQGGVGSQYQLNSGHETKYFYDKPSQTELDRLFGVDAGDAQHYLKNTVQDPNGQMSVAYVDAHGRTIATALAGDKPTALDKLESTPETPTDMTHRIRNGDKNGLLHAHHSYTVNSTGNHKLEYLLDKLQLNDFCNNPSVCYTCAYDLELKITSSDCGEGIVFQGVWQNFVPSDTICTNASTVVWRTVGNSPVFSSAVTKYLTAGRTYTIDKWLKVNQEQQERLLTKHLRSACVLPIDSFIQRSIREADCTDCEEGSINPDFGACEKPPCAPQNDCDALYRQLLADVAPTGQYGLQQNAAGQWLPRSLSAYASDAWRNVVYKDASGNLITVSINGLAFRPNDLTLEEFVRRYQPNWGHALVSKHPEYCFFQWCDNTTRRSWLNYEDTFTTEFLMEKVPNKADLLQLNTRTALNDPFWSVLNEAEKSSLNQVAAPAPHSDVALIGHLAANAIFCRNATSATACNGWSQFVANSCPEVNRMVYDQIKNLYFTQRRKLYLQRQDTDVSTSCHAQSVTAKNNQKDLRVMHWADVNTAISSGVGRNYSGEAALQLDSLCQGNASAWVQQLGIPLNAQQQSDLTRYFTQICIGGYSATEKPYGNIELVESASAVLVNGIACRNLEAVLRAYLGTSYNSCHLTQTVFNVVPPEFTPRVVTELATNDEICTRLTALWTLTCVAKDTARLLEYVNAHSNVTLLYEELVQLMQLCGPTTCGRFVPDAEITLPAVLQTGKCQDCTSLRTVANEYWSTICPNNAPTGTDVEARRKHFINYVNYKTGLNRSQEELLTFWSRCTNLHPNLVSWVLPFQQSAGVLNFPASCQTLLCPNTTNLTEEEVEEESCRTIVEREAIIQGVERYKAYLEEVKRAFRARYTQECLNKADASERLKFTAPTKLNHYTLYYYDQAGNLVQTVPPAGVSLLSTTDLATLETARDAALPFAPNATLRPAHTLKTRYWHNSLNQVVRQETPDAGVSQFWYDALGRLVLSQNAKQQSTEHFSYTLFDNLGRTTEVGELYKLGAPNTYDAIDTEVKTNFRNWQGRSSTAQVTRTYYDAVPSIAPAIANFTAQNLRNRVAMTTFSSLNNGTYDYATHYTYDVAGNVTTLIHDVPELEAETYQTVDAHGKVTDQTHRFKRLDYEFDLLSGKVNQLKYQARQPDQRLYAYRYDSDNRLTTALTSRDGVIWERDASYAYHRHAPLSRTVVGEREVQGLDYVYTLQGWIKGVNGAMTHHDVGGDANRDQIYGTSNDVFGYALQYNSADYQAIASSSSLQPANVSGFNPTNNPNFNYNLFNGNIRSIVNHIQGFSDIAYTYRYDQLNRITGMTSQSVSGNTWSLDNTGNHYREKVSYDANGNIQTYQRNDANGNGLDDLTYQYHATKRNQLRLVADAVGATPFGEDVEGTEKFEYDAIGNLTKHTKPSGVQMLTWNAYGKVSSVVKGDVTMTFGYDAQQNRLKKEVKTGTKQKINYYFRDAQGNVLSIYRKSTIFERGESYFFCEEQTLYGSARLGTEQVEHSMRGLVTHDGLTDAIIRAREQHGDDWQQRLQEQYEGSFYERLQDAWGNEWNTRLDLLLQGNNDTWLIEQIKNESYTLQAGNKRYELSNHLGNVLAVVSDKKMQTDGVVWQAEVVSAQDYFPFGMAMPGRTTDAKHRYGFNGKETDPETGIQDYGMRWYLPNIARFPSVDPLTKKYPWNSVYCFAENNPIEFVDLDGGEKKHYRVDFDQKTQKPTLTFLRQEDIVTTHVIGATDLNGNGADFYQTINETEQYVLHKSIREYLWKEGVDPQVMEGEVTLTVRDWNQAQSVEPQDFPAHTWAWCFAQHGQNMRDAGISSELPRVRQLRKTTITLGVRAFGEDPGLRVAAGRISRFKSVMGKGGKFVYEDVVMHGSDFKKFTMEEFDAFLTAEGYDGKHLRLWICNGGADPELIQALSTKRNVNIIAADGVVHVDPTSYHVEGGSFYIKIPETPSTK